ncbi:MAG: carboxypeptidase-like regulatory domain-containing protein, partial [Planctomycetota bacterium JB042]
SGPDGRYELPGFGASGVYDVHVRAAGYGKTETPDLELDGVGAELELDFSLEPARQATGRVVDAEGAPVEGAYVAAVANHWDDDRAGGAIWSQGTQVTDWVSTSSDADGRFALGDVRPDVRHALLVRAAGHGVAIVDFPADEPSSREIAFGEIVLAPPITLAGVVVDQHGRPVPRAEVALRGSPEGRFALSRRDEPWFEGYVDEREGRADVRGRFVFRDVAPGAYALEASLGRDEAGAPVDVTLRRGEERRDVELEIVRGLEVRGRVVGPNGETVSRAIVYVAPRAGGALKTRVVGGDGSFVVSGLGDGMVRVVAHPLARDDGWPAFRGSAPLDVPAGTRDVVVRLRPGARIAGKVVDERGGAVGRALVTAYDDAGEKVAGALSREDGGFELDVPPDAPVRLEVKRTIDSTTPGKAFDVVDERSVVVEGVRPGASDVEVTVASGG